VDLPALTILIDFEMFWIEDRRIEYLDILEKKKEKKTGGDGRNNKRMMLT
jgi:hypothetical protein